MQNATLAASNQDFQSLSIIYRSPANRDEPVFVALHIQFDKAAQSGQVRYQYYDQQNQESKSDTEIQTALPNAWYQDILQICIKASSEPQKPLDYGVCWVLTINNQSYNYWPSDQNQSYIFVEQLSQAILESSGKEQALQFCVSDTGLATNYLFGIEVFYANKQAKIWKKKPKDTEWQNPKDIDWVQWSEFVQALSTINWPNNPTDKIAKTKNTFSCDWGEGWLSIMCSDQLSDTEKKSLSICSAFLKHYLD